MGRCRVGCPRRLQSLGWLEEPSLTVGLLPRRAAPRSCGSPTVKEGSSRYPGVIPGPMRRESKSAPKAIGLRGASVKLGQDLLDPSFIGPA